MLKLILTIIEFYFEDVLQNKNYFIQDFKRECY